MASITSLTHGGLFARRRAGELSSHSVIRSVPSNLPSWSICSLIITSRRALFRGLMPTCKSFQAKCLAATKLTRCFWQIFERNMNSLHSDFLSSSSVLSYESDLPCESIFFFSLDHRVPAAASTFVGYELTMEFLQKHTSLWCWPVGCGEPNRNS
jgi:hypothetical protein